MRLFYILRLPTVSQKRTIAVYPNVNQMKFRRVLLGTHHKTYTGGDMGKLTDIQIRSWIKAGEHFESRGDGDGLA